MPPLVVEKLRYTYPRALVTTLRHPDMTKVGHPRPVALCGG